MAWEPCNLGGNTPSPNSFIFNAKIESRSSISNLKVKKFLGPFELWSKEKTDGL